MLVEDEVATERTISRALETSVQRSRAETSLNSDGSCMPYHGEAACDWMIRLPVASGCSSAFTGQRRAGLPLGLGWACTSAVG
jgi:hypothetical protein